MDVIVAGEPVFRRLVPAVKLDIDGFRFSRFKREGSRDGCEKESAIGFDAVVARG